MFLCIISTSIWRQFHTQFTMHFECTFSKIQMQTRLVQKTFLVLFHISKLNTRNIFSPHVSKAGKLIGRSGASKSGNLSSRPGGGEIFIIFYFPIRLEFISLGFKAYTILLVYAHDWQSWYCGCIPMGLQDYNLAVYKTDIPLYVRAHVLAVS